MWTEGYVTGIDYTYGYHAELSPARLQFSLLTAGYDVSLPAAGAMSYLELGFGQGLSLTIHAAATGGRFWVGCIKRGKRNRHPLKGGARFLRKTGHVIARLRGLWDVFQRGATRLWFGAVHAVLKQKDEACFTELRRWAQCLRHPRFSSPVPYQTGFALPSNNLALC